MLKIKSKATTSITSHKSTNTLEKNNNMHMMLSYLKGLGMKFKNICGQLGIQVYFKVGNTITNLTVIPKDKYTITQKSEVIYR